MTRLPWIPAEQQWLEILEAARCQPVRNRVMLALAYDAAPRREELCSLQTSDLDPAHRTLRVRAETTKNRRERVVPYSVATGEQLSGYLVPPVRHQPGPRAVVLVGVAAQPCPAAEPMDLVEGGAPDRAASLCSAVLHPSPAASVPDRLGADGLGGACDRGVRRASPR